MRSASRPLGAATLTETYLRDDPPGAGAVEQAALAARNEIISAKEQLYENLNNTGIIPNPLSLPVPLERLPLWRQCI